MFSWTCTARTAGPVEPGRTVCTSAPQVCAPITPSWLRPLAAWKLRTAEAVPEPKTPSAATEMFRRLQQVLHGQHVDAAVAVAQDVEARLRVRVRRRHEAQDGHRGGGQHQPAAGQDGSAHRLSSKDGGAAARPRGSRAAAHAGQMPQLGALQLRRGPLSTWVWSSWAG